MKHENKLTKSEYDAQLAKLINQTDHLIHQFMAAFADGGTPVKFIIERLMTACAAHLVKNLGVERASKAFRAVAQDIEAGAFMHIETIAEGTKH